MKASSAINNLSILHLFPLSSPHEISICQMFNAIILPQTAYIIQLNCASSPWFISFCKLCHYFQNRLLRPVTIWLLPGYYQVKLSRFILNATSTKTPQFIRIMAFYLSFYVVFVSFKSTQSKFARFTGLLDGHRYP